MNIVDKKRIFIVGSGGSGKDYLRNKFERKGYSFGVHYTTRPKRNNEVEGVDYFFISDEEFKKLISENILIEYTEHNNWYYGLSYEEFNNKDLFIISLKSYLKYSKEIKESIFKVFLDIDESVRRTRLSKRNDADTVDRRIESDNKDIENINKQEFDLIIKNDDF